MNIFLNLIGKCGFCNLEYYMNTELNTNQIPSITEEDCKKIREGRGENIKIDFSFLKEKEKPCCPSCDNPLTIEKINYIEEI